MKFDNPRIAIRRRKTYELMDLSLHVIRTYPIRLALAMLVVIAPMLFLNDFLISHLLLIDSEYTSFVHLDSPEYKIAYADIIKAPFITTMICLVIIQAPIVSVLSVILLGQIVFGVESSLRKLISESLARFGVLFWSVGCLRGIIPGLLVAQGIAIRNHRSYEDHIGLLVLITLYVVILRMVRPFIFEIILLEKTPLFKKSKQQITLSKRSRGIHRSRTGIGGRVMSGMIMSMIITTSLIGGMIFFATTFVNQHQTTLWVLRWGLPISMWMAAGFLSIVRFLNYLDVRIEMEGWEAELLIRAEAEKMKERIQLGNV